MKYGLVYTTRVTDEDVTGCAGNDSSGTDYCHSKPYENYIWNIVYKFPLDLCEGDCDVDDDCTEGLLCFKRGGGDNLVPGCEGKQDGKYWDDYCFNPRTLQDIGNDGSPLEFFPLGPCQGDYDDDDECQVRNQRHDLLAMIVVHLLL